MSAANASSSPERRGGAPERIGDVLPRVVPGFKAQRRRGNGVAERWARAAGPDLSQETRAATLNRGVLTVEVRSAALLHELSAFRTDELLSRLLAEDPSGRIRGLRFRPGVF